MIIVSGKPGQLGNRLILASHVYGFGCAHGLRVINPAFAEYSVHFEGPSHDALGRWPRQKSWFRGIRLGAVVFFAVNWFCRLAHRLHLQRNRFWTIVEWHDASEFDLRDPQFIALAKQTPLVFLRGYRFRDYENFLAHGSAIHRYFRPVIAIRSRVDALLSRARAGAEVLVGLHVRRGDYREYLGGIYYFDWSHYAACARQIVALFPGRQVRFLVCSNEKTPLAEFETLDVMPGPGEAVEDLYALSQCDFIIGPPSTFSSWASASGKVPLRFLTSAEDSIALADFKVFPWEWNAHVEAPAAAPNQGGR